MLRHLKSLESKLQGIEWDKDDHFRTSCPFRVETHAGMSKRFRAHYGFLTANRHFSLLIRFRVCRERDDHDLSRFVPDLFAGRLRILFRVFHKFPRNGQRRMTRTCSIINAFRSESRRHRSRAIPKAMDSVLGRAHMKAHGMFHPGTWLSRIAARPAEALTLRNNGLDPRDGA